MTRLSSSVNRRYNGKEPLMRKPAKILISIGREVGGITSFSKSLGAGFEALGYSVVYFKPKEVFSHFRDLRSKDTLKILSTTAVFFAPLFKNTICVAHGFPRIGGQGFLKWFFITMSFYLASKHSTLVAVSHYVKNHIAAFFGIVAKDVVYNPLRQEFFTQKEVLPERTHITYIGRLHPVKNVPLFIQPLKNLLDKNPGYTVTIVGIGDDKNVAIRLADRRFKFVNHLDEEQIVDLLYRTKVFFSGCDTEALGISFIEALACGCSVVMPLSGGSLEIAPELTNKGVFTFSPSFGGIEEALKEAIAYDAEVAFDATRFCSKTIANHYLKVGGWTN